MKSTLLTTTALVMLAGATTAYADGHTGISYTGDFALGYNDDDVVGEDGFYWDANIDVTMSAALDNGITATVTGELNVASDDAADESRDAVFDELTLVLASETASLSFGDVDPVAEDRFGGVDGDSTAGFNDLDAHFDVVGFDAMLVGEVEFGGVTAALSYGVFTDTPAGDLEVIDALQVYATGDFGQFGFEIAYQDEIDGITEYTVLGVSGSATFAGAEITVAYLDDETETSTGIGVAYPVGPVTLSGYYSVNDPSDDSYGVAADYSDGPIAVNVYYDFTGESDGGTPENTEIGVEGSYDVGNGLTVLAGYISSEDDGADAENAFYAAATYDLGGGAELLVAYAEDDDDTNDEIGDPEYLPGTTVEVSFSF